MVNVVKIILFILSGLLMARELSVVVQPVQIEIAEETTQKEVITQQQTEVKKIERDATVISFSIPEITDKLIITIALPAPRWLLHCAFLN
ncbi:MAG: hypothetical protein J0L67_17660 [Cytophagales bacterium]|nr:hypothetical protein [Cytophagales bacterium]